MASNGRFVRVRTWGSNQGGLPSYVGHDEITIYSRRENDNSKPENVQWRRSFPPPQIAQYFPGLNYRISEIDWPARSMDQPLLLGPGPSFYLGDDSLHFSDESVHAIEFIPLITTSKIIGGVEISCVLPDTVDVVAWNNRHRLHSSALFRMESLSYRKYTLLLDGADLENYLTYPFMLVSLAANASAGYLGECSWSWSYTIDGRPHPPGSGQLHLIADNLNGVSAPRRFLTGFWTPYAARSFSDPSVIDKLMKTWKNAGFNTAIGGYGGEPAISAAKHNNLTMIREAGILPNGLSIRGIEVPVQDRFTPNRSNQKIAGVCPTAIIEDERYANYIERIATQRLNGSDHLYENWEPYSFLDSGCICRRCRTAFEKKLGHTLTELEWNGSVSSRDFEYMHFISVQFASIMKMYQGRVRAAGLSHSPDRKSNITFALNPEIYIDKKSKDRPLHDAKDFMPFIDQLCIWTYPNQVPLMRVTAEQLVGNTLTSMSPLIKQALDAARITGRQDSQGRCLPRIIVMQGGYQLNGQHIVLPMDASFTALLAFFSGTDGIATFEMQQRPDARYLSANAQAHALIAALEDIVFDGKDISDAAVIPISPQPTQIRGRQVQTLWWRAITGSGRQIVAIANDHVLPVYLQVQIPSQFSREMLDIANDCIYHCNFDGKKNTSFVKVNAKSWGIFDVIPISGKKTIPPESILAASLSDEPAAKAFIAACQDESESSPNGTGP